MVHIVVNYILYKWGNTESPKKYFFFISQSVPLFFIEFMFLVYTSLGKLFSYIGRISNLVRFPLSHILFLDK